MRTFAWHTTLWWKAVTRPGAAQYPRMLQAQPACPAHRHEPALGCVSTTATACHACLDLRSCPTSVWQCKGNKNRLRRGRSAARHFTPGELMSSLPCAVGKRLSSAPPREMAQTGTSWHRLPTPAVSPPCSRWICPQAQQQLPEPCLRPCVGVLLLRGAIRTKGTRTRSMLIFSITGGQRIFGPLPLSRTTVRGRQGS